MNTFWLFFTGGLVISSISFLPIGLLQEGKNLFKYISLFFLCIFFALIVGILGWLDVNYKVNAFLIFFTIGLVFMLMFLLVERESPFKHIFFLIFFALIMGILGWLRSYGWDVMMGGW